jgi:hypothetical protein
MATVLLSPVGNGQQFFDNNGLPLSGGLIYQYQAGSSTPLATYTSNSGAVPNSNPIVLDTAGRTPQEVWMQFGYSYKFVLQTSAGVTLQTLDNLYPILQNSTAAASPIPTGLITMWSGSIGSIPAGWALCNGANGTPDLRDRFVIAAGSTYAVSATGGSADAIVVSHNHTVIDPGHTHDGVTRFGQGTLRYTLTGYTGTGATTAAAGGDSTSQTTDSATTGITNQATGSSGVNANLPPYYALAYIMKT